MDPNIHVVYLLITWRLHKRCIQCEEISLRAGQWFTKDLSQGLDNDLPKISPGIDPRDGYCCGRYASYWNAFLLDHFLVPAQRMCWHQSLKQISSKVYSHQAKAIISLMFVVFSLIFLSILWSVKRLLLIVKFRFARRITFWFGESEFSVGYPVQVHIIGTQTDRQTHLRELPMIPNPQMSGTRTERQTDRQTDSPERVTYDTEPTDERYEDVFDEESNEGHGRVQVLWHPCSVTVVVQSIVYKTEKFCFLKSLLQESIPIGCVPLIPTETPFTEIPLTETILEGTWYGTRDRNPLDRTFDQAARQEVTLYKRFWKYYLASYFVCRQ